MAILGSDNLLSSYVEYWYGINVPTKVSSGYASHVLFPNTMQLLTIGVGSDQITCMLGGAVSISHTSGKMIY